MSIPNTDRLYLFGGICQEPMSAMATFDVSRFKNAAKYRVIEKSQLHGDEKISGVFGFGSCVYKGKFYYFFGGLGFDKAARARLCTS